MGGLGQWRHDKAEGKEKLLTLMESITRVIL